MMSFVGAGVDGGESRRFVVGGAAVDAGVRFLTADFVGVVV